MKLDDELRGEIGKRAKRARERRFGTKLAAYQAAGVNAATWDRIEEGQPVRPDRLILAVKTLWPDTGGDWRQVISEGPGGDEEIALEQRVEALEKQVAALTDQIKDLSEVPLILAASTGRVDEEVESWEEQP